MLGRQWRRVYDFPEAIDGGRVFPDRQFVHYCEYISQARDTSRTPPSVRDSEAIDVEQVYHQRERDCLLCA